MLVAACGGEAGPSTSTIPTSFAATTSTSVPEHQNDLALFDRVEIILGGESWTVAVADTPVLQARGLMGVTNLSVDGMLFVFVDTVAAAFWMKDTLIPLDIAFFGANGSLVDTFTMTPCEEDPCPTYPASGSFRYAIETTVGGFSGLDPLTLDVSDF